MNPDAWKHRQPKCPTKAPRMIFAPITQPIVGAMKIPRNGPCGCGSVKKFKQCCLPKLNEIHNERRSDVA